MRTPLAMLPHPVTQRQTRLCGARCWRGSARSGAICERARLAPGLLAIGRDFPARWADGQDGLEAHARAVARRVAERVGPVPRLMAEPGCALAAEAGVIEASVLLVARRRESDFARWVHLDIGRVSGRAVTEGEAIHDPLETTADGGPAGPCILAGPSCDPVDALCERWPVQLPLALAGGDRVRLLSAGACAASYASVGFNGFPALDVVCL